MSRYVLGIDGGGTRTRAAIMDERGQLMASGEAGPSNYDDIGIAQAQANIAAAVTAARQEAQLKAPFSAAFLGLAGVVSDRDKEIVQGIARNLELTPARAVGVDHDCRIALAGGLSGRPGVVLIVGTGSSCYGRTVDGQSWRAGGWGALISDEGSGYWLGREGLRAASRALDGRGPNTVLAQCLLEHLGVQEPNDLLHRLYVPSIARAEVASLAPIVMEAARGGDRVAEGLVQQGIKELAECVQAVAAKLGFSNGFELVVVGGLAQAEAFIVERLGVVLAHQGVTFRVVAPELPPVLGACLLALKLIDKDRPERVTIS